MTLHWSAAFVGIPHVESSGGSHRTGLHCYGLARLVWRARAGIRVPSYANVSAAERAEIDRLVHGEIDASQWVAVSEARELDAVLFRNGEFDSHIGVMIDAIRMLHSDRQAGASRIERVDVNRWHDRFVGFYRHRRLLAA